MKKTSLFVAAACGAISLLNSATAANAKTADSAKPNILFILTDDQGYGDWSINGHPLLKTPNVDRLAKQSVRLENFYVSPSCSPTRAALMTGRYPQRCAWVPDDELSAVSRAQRADNVKQRWAWGISRDEVTLPGLLRRAGYRTSLIGKWHLGYDVAFHPLNHGFDEFRGFVGGAVDYHTHVATHGSQTLDWWQDRGLRDEPGPLPERLPQARRGQQMQRRVAVSAALLFRGFVGEMDGRAERCGQPPFEFTIHIAAEGHVSLTDDGPTLTLDTPHLELEFATPDQ